jgi:hypothetical protein
VILVTVSAPVELGYALFEEDGLAFLLVVSCRAEAEIGSFEQQPFVNVAAAVAMCISPV